MAVVFPFKRPLPGGAPAGFFSSHQDLPPPKRTRMGAGVVESGACYRPKKGEHPLGEDAHFINLNGRGFGVADGVGSWSRRGVDAGVFARQLMSLCDETMEAISRYIPSGCFLDGVLESALAETTAGGTSTACIGMVDGNTLRVVSIGDSGVVVVRDGVVAFHSPSQQSRFNCPFQIGRANEGDPVDMAKSFTRKLLPGDIIVAATDGLFDNLFDDEIADLLTRLRKERPPRRTAKEMASALAAAAVASAFNTTRDTPFAASSAQAGVRRTGGKVDDVTVVVMQFEADDNNSRDDADQ